MADIQDQTFTGGTVDLDGNLYRNCRFEGVIIRYSGDGDVGLQGCFFEGCTLALDGAAARTISYLTAIHGGLGDWGRRNVDNLIRAIQGDASGVQLPH